jgi:AraC-like DNA-binding protein
MNNITDDLIITQVTDVITVHNARGKVSRISNRATYGLTFCRDGQIRYTQDGIDTVECKNSAVILPKGKSYSLRTERDGEFPVINFLCEGEPWDCVTAYPIDDVEPLIASYEKIMSLSLYEGNRLEIMSLLYGIMHKVLDNEDRGALTAAVKYIEENYYDSELSNSLLAEKCHISEVYFRRLFSEHFGVTPRRFLIEIRMNKAKQLLSGGSLKVSAVSEKCGFSNPYHFCRAFKKHTGLTPTEYMMKNRTSDI